MEYASGRNLSVPFQGPHGRSAVSNAEVKVCVEVPWKSSHTKVDSSPGAKARVMDVDAEPINPQASDADTVGNLTYIEGDVLDFSLATSIFVAISL